MFNNCSFCFLVLFLWWRESQPFFFNLALFQRVRRRRRRRRKWRIMEEARLSGSWYQGCTLICDQQVSVLLRHVDLSRLQVMQRRSNTAVLQWTWWRSNTLIQRCCSFKLYSLWNKLISFIFPKISAINVYIFPTHLSNPYISLMHPYCVSVCVCVHVRMGLHLSHLAQGAHQLRRVLRVVESRGSQSFRMVRCHFFIFWIYSCNLHWQICWDPCSMKHTQMGGAY